MQESLRLIRASKARSEERNEEGKQKETRRHYYGCEFEALALMGTED